MAESKRLAAHRASASIAAKADSTEIPNPEDDEDEQDEEECNDTSKPKKDKTMNEAEHKAAIEAARAEGVKEGEALGAKAERDRTAAVFASEHYAGREALAAKMLGKNMSAEDIIDLLAETPKSPAPGGVGDDSAAREEMRRQLAEDQPPATGEGGDRDNEPKADTSLVDNMKARFAAKN